MITKPFKLSFYSFFASSHLFPAMAFLIPLAMRALPEVLMGPYIVGFDTLGYYVPNTLTWLRQGVDWWSLLAVAPLFYALMMSFVAAGVPIVWWLKTASPLLLSLLGVAVYFYANKTLSWSPKKSLLTAMFATLYFVALRVSWDMLRSELALIFLFAALIFLGKNGESISRRNIFLLSAAAVTVTLSHQLVSVIMLAILFLTAVRLHVGNNARDAFKIMVSVVPAFTLFLLTVYANYLNSSVFSVVTDVPKQTNEGFSAIFGFPSYPNFVLNTIGFLFYSYIPVLPLLILGIKHYKRNLQLEAWILLAMFVVGLAIISPNASFAGLPYRWILLLTYPLAFLAVEAFTNLQSKRLKTTAGLFLTVLSIGFLVLPNSVALPYFTMFPSYVPTSMLQNTVTLTDCQDTFNAMQWAEKNMPAEAKLLVHDAFYGWALLYAGNTRLLPYGYDEPSDYLQQIAQTDLKNNVYLIWWKNGSGWHGQSDVSDAFTEVHASGQIAVYRYNPNNTPQFASFKIEAR